MTSHSTRAAIVAAVAAGALAVAGCSATPEEENLDREITIAVDPYTVDIAIWDPAQGGGLSSIDVNYLAQATMSTLFYFEGDGSGKPVIGESYEFADDRKSVEVTLREGIEFSDGSPVDADAVVACYEHYLAEGSQYVFRSTAVDAGAEFSAVDDRTVLITFAQPVFHPDYLVFDVVRLLLGSPILSPAGLADPEKASAGPMSVGPYVIEDYQPAVGATLVRNPDYWDPESYPYDTIVLKAFDDTTAKLNALKSGQVDVSRVTTEQIAEAEASGFHIQYSSWTYVVLQFRDPDGGKSVPLRDVRVRQAMAYAFDREAIAESLELGYGEVSSQILVEGNPGYIDGGDDRYDYDPEKARELMAEAGYADGFDLSIPGDGGKGKYEPIVQQSLADIGIRVTYFPMADAGGAFKAFTSPEWPVTLYEEPNVNAIRLLDESFVGFGRYFDPDEEIDRLLERIKFGDAEESAAASQELGEKLLEEVWYLPISRPPAAWASRQGDVVDTDDIIGGGTWLHHFHPAD